MPRIQPVHPSKDSPTVTLLEAVKATKGKIPNIISTMANSVGAATAYLGFSQALSAGSLSPRVREQIALIVGQSNRCDYYLAAYTTSGKSTGLSDENAKNARKSGPNDLKTEVPFVSQWT